MRAQDKETDQTRGRAGAGRTPAPGPAAGLLALQRAAGNAAVARAVEEQRHEHDAHCGHGPSVQRSAVHDVLRSPGQRMDDPLLNEMQGRFGGQDFSDVRLHTDAAALDSAAQIEAQAYTSYPHVVWDGGDKEVLAEELHHIGQQKRGPVPGTDNGDGLMISDPGDWAEVEARQAAREAMSGPAPVQRSAAESAPEQRDGGGVGRPAVQRSPAAGSSSRTSGGRVTKAKGRAGAKGAATSPSEAVKQALIALGWEAHGANQSLTLHKVDRSQATDEQKAAAAGTSKKGQMYIPSEQGVPPRSYAGERTKQVLRWISTVVNRAMLQKNERPEEVQAGMEVTEAPDVEAAFKLFVSTNRVKVNNVLREGAGTKAAKEYIVELLETVVGQTDRETRHMKKLRSLLAKEAESTPPEFWEVLQALTGPMTVPVPTKDGKHAERTIIGAAAPGSISDDHIAGVKRPCVSCFIELYAGSDIRPGPAWVSGAANTDIADFSVEKAAQLAKRIDDTVSGTFATLLLRCEEHDGETTQVPVGATWDYNTDSDSPASSSDREPDPADRMDTSA
ncbi:hypothetical protein CTU88_42435 [Streptomyces sp. JV178]|uniref:eCIS core domain-containing protein n=1 Tax=Streptomyces sp. JV178 TaxID=858632 RepID=UPI000C573D88|nr:DUF4157 domain-containing protein [Streptomyces sp. JV178]PIM66553.1 hypothetical protein CTU88_42435 [Streptomyces sp. JV178]